MSNTEMSSTLVKVGAWLQLPFSIFLIIFSAWFLLIMWPVLIDPILWPIFGWWMVVLFVLLIIFGILGFFLTFVWLRWQHDIAGHQKALIGTGIFGIIFTGTVPGLLIIIGAAIHPSEKA